MPLTASKAPLLMIRRRCAKSFTDGDQRKPVMPLPFSRRFVICTSCSIRPMNVSRPLKPPCSAQSANVTKMERCPAVCKQSASYIERKDCNRHLLVLLQHMKPAAQDGVLLCRSDEFMLHGERSKSFVSLGFSESSRTRDLEGMLLIERGTVCARWTLSAANDTETRVIGLWQEAERTALR